MDRIRHLVFAGGGSRGGVFVGALKYIKESFGVDYGLRTHELTTIVGTSIGSVIGFMIAIGFSVEKIEAFTKSFHFLEGYDISDSPVLGLSDGIEFRNVLAKMMHDTLHDHGHDESDAMASSLMASSCSDDDDLDLSRELEMTFDEFHRRTKIDLICTATSITTGQSVFLRARSHKKMRVVDAVFASCCLPILWTPFRYDDDLLVDGGIVNNYPINVLAHSEVDPDTILGFNIKYEARKLHDLFMKNRLQYFVDVVFLMINAFNQMNFSAVRSQYKERTIDILVHDSANPFAIVVTDETTFQTYIDTGYLTAKLWFAN